MDNFTDDVTELVGADKIEPDVDLLGASPVRMEPKQTYFSAQEPVYATLWHGPCLSSGISVADKQRNYLFPARILTDLSLRQREGQIKYGRGLTVGWPPADIALYQEILDGCQYAIAGKRVILAHALAWLALCIRLSLHWAWVRGQRGRSDKAGRI